jgi:hypothetical protein
MKRTFRAHLAVGTITALGLVATSASVAAQGGIGGNAGTPDQHTVLTPPLKSAPAPSTGLMIGTANGGNDGVLMQLSPFAVLGTFPGLFTNMAGLSNLPGTPIFSMTGGMASGGLLYHFLGNGSLVGGFATGYSSVPGLTWAKTPAGTVGGYELLGSAAVSIIGDGLIHINPITGASTGTGTYGGGVGGIDAIAQDPTTGIVYGSSGYFYDGSPGDKITIDPATGLATDTFTDMSPQPPCVVGGMTIDFSGQAYISMGGGGVGCSGAGRVYTWNLVTNAIALVGDGATGSLTDIQGLF